MRKKPHRTQISITVKNTLVGWIDDLIELGIERSRGAVIEKALTEYKKAREKESLKLSAT